MLFQGYQAFMARLMTGDIIGIHANDLSSNW